MEVEVSFPLITAKCFESEKSATLLADIIIVVMGSY